MLSRRIGIRGSYGVRSLSTSITRSIQFKGNFRNSDSNVETDEIVTGNNPWSPTLYNDIISIRKPGKILESKLPSNYRLSYQPLYEAPGAKYVGMLKRLTLSFTVLGVYGAKLFFDSSQFDDIYGIMTIISCAIPAALVQYKTRDYVTRIFRVYNKDKPQTLQNLIEDEKLIMEKLNFTGGKTYNELLQISNNPSLTITDDNSQSKISSIFKPYSTWQEIEPESNQKRHYFVVDNIGGLKMDRIWGLLEHNKGIDSGR